MQNNDRDIEMVEEHAKNNAPIIKSDLETILPKIFVGSNLPSSIKIDDETSSVILDGLGLTIDSELSEQGKPTILGSMKYCGWRVTAEVYLSGGRDEPPSSDMASTHENLFTSLMDLYEHVVRMIAEMAFRNQYDGVVVDDLEQDFGSLYDHNL